MRRFSLVDLIFCFCFAFLSISSCLLGVHVIVFVGLRLLAGAVGFMLNWEVRVCLLDLSMCLEQDVLFRRLFGEVCDKLYLFFVSVLLFPVCRI